MKKSGPLKVSVRALRKGVSEFQYKLDEELGDDGFLSDLFNNEEEFLSADAMSMQMSINDVDDDDEIITVSVLVSFDELSYLGCPDCPHRHATSRVVELTIDKKTGEYDYAVRSEYDRIITEAAD